MEPAKQRLEFPRKLTFLLDRYAPIKAAHGGRNGIKSWTFAQALVLRAAKERKRIVCGREIQNSIADSVHQLLVDTIERLGMARRFIVTDHSIYCIATGSTFVFKGLKTNIDSIKSLESADILWLEEAAKISKTSWDKILPTMRKPGCEIWVTFNPDEEDDPTYQLLVKNPYPGAIVVKTGWQDNKWMTPEMHNLRRYMKLVDPDNYDHVWEGECKNPPQLCKGRRECGIQNYRTRVLWEP